MIAQGSGLRAPFSCPQGQSFSVDVATNDDSVEVHSGDGQTRSYPVGPDKRVQVPPTGAAGDVLCITVGRGRRRRIVFVLITPAQP